jgi:hypothetical protein
VARRVDHPRRGDHQRIARLPSGRPGGEVARFHPQHALAGGANPAQRANGDDRGGEARAGGHCVSRIRRQDPGDLRLVEVKNRRTEEAALTGESAPSDKSTAPVSAKATVGDRAGMAYSGTLVVSGRATGLVVATGGDTELGRINQMLAGVSALETPLLLRSRNSAMRLRSSFSSSARSLSSSGVSSAIFRSSKCSRR